MLLEVSARPGSAVSSSSLGRVRAVFIVLRSMSVLSLAAFSTAVLPADLLSLLLSVLSLSSSHWCVGPAEGAQAAVLCGAPAPVHSGQRCLRRIPSPGRPATTASSSPPSTPASGPPAWRTSSPTPGVRGRGGIRGPPQTSSASLHVCSDLLVCTYNDLLVMFLEYGIFTVLMH